ncbi:septation protein A [Oharaeibacter diazotrophicus]|uniref:Inner membrane-spanning protein YciB n=1 Tax=Oharaeibacter diazotrophicus TaxID=1920512 RepID=A0A4R6RDX3_9HYPH|nr:septation protein A [Oharaeibacter diazotrophicus]TDP84362.1 intracellular septation protein [Oharaeibacter diazotrophicus]BBE73399.1 intracellular septation protein [Pleomorphomonas sp. SM30]GLS75192.1 putative intracellular septation protein A [Oharaeibacter diazotrophicus]
MEFEKGPDDPATRHENPLVKLALELGPLGVFFFANARADIFTATAAFMAAMVVSLAISWTLTRRLAVMPVVTGVVVLVFGTLTLVLHDDTFIKMKPTIVNGLFAAVLLGGLAFGKALLGYVFDGAFRLDAAGWRKLTLRWGLFFVFLAVVNEAVWRTQTTDFWVAFKVWGIMPITLVFSALQLPLMSRHALDRD